MEMTYKLLTICFFASSINLSAQNSVDSLTKKIHKLDEVIILGSQTQQKNLLSPRMGNVSVSAELIKSIPMMFGEADVLKALQVQPGVSTGVEGFSGMYVRGGENDENMYVLHNLPLYHVSHIGGFFSSFNVATIDRVNFYKSGFPPSFGGRVSSFTDIRLKESNYEKLQGQIALGLLSGNVFLTAPLRKDKVAFSVGIRRSWLDLLTIPTLAIINKINKEDGRKKIGRYAFTDLNLKLDYKMNNRMKGYTQLYYGNDYLKIGEELFSDDKEDGYSEENITRMKWGNWGVSTGIDWYINISTLFSFNAYYTHYISDFKQGQEMQSMESEKVINEYIHKINSNGIDDLGVNVQLDKNFDPKYKLKTGLNYIYHDYLPERLLIDSNKDNYRTQVLIPIEKIKAHEVALYLENDILIGEECQANIGLRGVCYVSSNKRHVALEPRLNLRYSLTNDFSIKAGYSRMTQFIQQICNSYISLPTDSWQPISNRWNPLATDQISVGLYGNLPHGFYFSVEAYYKYMNNLLEYKEGINSFSSDIGWNDKLTSGKGWAYGVDMSLYKNTGQLTGSIGYSLLWTQRRFGELNRGNTFPSKYDNRHKFNISCNYQWTKNMEWNASWTYMTGNRVTLALNNYHGTEGAGFPEDIAPTGVIQNKWGLDYYSTRNNVRLPAYHRLDIGVNIYRRLSKGRVGIWNISLYNAYSRMNPIAINKNGVENIYGESGKWTTRFQTLSIFPIIPSVSYTYKF